LQLKQALERPWPWLLRQTLHAEPEKVLAGMEVLADGTNWDPGSGAGFYRRNADNTAWEYMEASSVLALLNAHLADTTDAHDASAISNVPAGSIAATDVQAALNELDAEKQPLDATLTALAAANWAANALPIGTGADTLAQTSFAANTFPARASTGDLVAKTITDFGLSLVDDVDAAAARATLGVGAVGTQGDGDKGDITVSGSGGAWTIDNDAVTYAKMQNVSATDRLLGRQTAGAGDVEEITCTAAGRAILDDASASDQRATLGLGTIATQNANSVTITGGAIDGTAIGATTANTGKFTTLETSGNIGLGAAPSGNINLRLIEPVTGGATAVGAQSIGAVQSDVTTAAYYFRSDLSTDASVFTLASGIHFGAVQGTIGAGSTVTNQYGFRAFSSLTGATNNYGFYSEIATAANRWNFYANGTAPNYFRGLTTFGDKFGYGTLSGIGGTVTQGAGSGKATSVTLSKVTGEITMNNAALAADTTVSFTLTNTTLEAADVLILNHASGGTLGSYLLNASCASGSATIYVRNITAGSLSEAIVIRFAVVRGATS
jgi:hypothetical protein